MKPVVLVIAGEGVGGVEKRLTEVWLHLAPRIPALRMLVRRSTFEQLLLRPDLAGLVQYRDRVTLVETAASSYPATMAAFACQLWRQPRGSIVHHILQGPPMLHRLRGHRVILSWVGNSYPRPREKFRDWLASAFSLRGADVVDVLNPEMLKQFSRRRGLRPKLQLTKGGTIVDGKTFRPGTKRNEIVFLGRMEKFKNALAFVEAIPAIAQRLAEAGRRASFRLYGRPADQGEAVRECLEGPGYRALDVFWSETRDPASVLAPAKLFMSLQSPSNYPSKALAEAMAAGCVPVISDSGESRLMADPTVAHFVPEDFTADDLAEAADEILGMDEETFAKRSAAIRADALQRFRVEPQADYFARLYAELGAANDSR